MPTSKMSLKQFGGNGIIFSLRLRKGNRLIVALDSLHNNNSSINEFFCLKHHKDAFRRSSMRTKNENSCDYFPGNNTVPVRRCSLLAANVLLVLFGKAVFEKVVGG